MDSGLGPALELPQVRRLGAQAEGRRRIEVWLAQALESGERPAARRGTPFQIEAQFADALSREAQARPTFPSEEELAPAELVESVFRPALIFPEATGLLKRGLGLARRVSFSIEPLR